MVQYTIPELIFCYYVLTPIQLEGSPWFLRTFTRYHALVGKLPSRNSKKY